MGTFERPSAGGSCTFKPVVPEASLWPIGCPEVAESGCSGRRIRRHFADVQAHVL